MGSDSEELELRSDPQHPRTLLGHGGTPSPLPLSQAAQPFADHLRASRDPSVGGSGANPPDWRCATWDQARANESWRARPRRDVDAVTHQVAIAFLDNVAEMNADTKFDAPLRRQTGFALDHQVLNLDAATNSVDDTAKFHEDSIAGWLHDASVVDGDRRIDQVASQGTQPCQRAVLVRSGQPAESDDVRREDRSKLSRLSHVRALGLATQYFGTEKY